MKRDEIIRQFEDELFIGKDPKVYDYEKRYGPLDKETHDILILMRAMRQHASETALPETFRAEKRTFLEQVIRADQAADDGKLSLGEYIAQQRRIRNLTTAGLAGQLGMNQADYQRFEADRATLPGSVLRQLAKILNLSLSRLARLKPAEVPQVRLAWAARRKRKGKK